MRFCAMFCLFFLCANASLAEPLSGASLAFNIKQANKKFDHINLQLSVQDLDLNNLNAAVNTLTGLVTEAEHCVEDAQKKLNNTEMLIKQDSGSVDSKTEGADLVYLNSEQKALADKQSQCRLFTIRAQEAIEAYKAAIAKLKQEEAFTQGLPLWKIIDQTINSPHETELIKVFTAQLPTSLPPLFSLALLILVSVIASIAILFRVRKSQFARHQLRFKQIHTRHVVLLSSFFILGSLFIYLLTFSQDFSNTDIPLVLSGIVFFYLSSLVGIVFLFKMKKVRLLLFWYSLNYDFFQTFSITFLSFYTVEMIGRVLSSSFNTDSPLWQFCQSLFILLVLATTAYFIYSFCKVHRQFTFVKNHHGLIQRLSALLLIACATINILGYHTLAQHLTFSGFTTLAILFITILITQAINRLYLMLSQQPTTKSKVMKHLGYKSDQTFMEFLILKTVAQVIIIAISIYLIGQSWGFATNFIESLYDQFLHGVHFLNITFYPTRIISGVVVFCVLYLLFRSISTAISSHQQFEDEEETQVAVASILTYVGFSFAFVTGLLIAGFDFTGLAIIAGALSVGIGLGLQSIVNNFVSGLILLIEKPIRPGDRINVDGVEGFVKKISIRSTQLITTSREDIIVPNSDLITRRVTNYMFSDKYGRINCEVGVSYGSNTTLVHDVLLDIANNHEEVIKSQRNKPVVLFRSFADNSLVFQLVCLIKDVNKKSIVQSDLNYAINEAFAKHNIEMPYPQQEIHLKLTEITSLLTKVNELAPS